jgi:hypothetical protein
MAQLAHVPLGGFFATMHEIERARAAADQKDERADDDDEMYAGHEPADAAPVDAGTEAAAATSDVSRGARRRRRRLETVAAPANTNLLGGDDDADAAAAAAAVVLPPHKRARRRDGAAEKKVGVPTFLSDQPADAAVAGAESAAADSSPPADAAEAESVVADSDQPADGAAIARPGRDRAQYRAPANLERRFPNALALLRVRYVVQPKDTPAAAVTHATAADVQLVLADAAAERVPAYLVSDVVRCALPGAIVRRDGTVERVRGRDGASP